ncbi:MAG: hypothetical protein JSV22_04735 [Bacteroidales bacterium]|nr:MAG: hypothetical protein JSV22_04735 [Bacteroidales bacterium]
MVKLLVTYFSLLLVFFISRVQTSDVSVRLDVPAEVTAGTEFEVSVTVSKGDIESFSRFQQEIPAGLTANSHVSSNADFSFEDKRVRMIWLRMPEDDEFTFIYKIKVDERLTGTFSIGGKFSYIDNNERRSVSPVAQSIYINPSPTIDPNLIVDINEFEEKVIQYIPPVSTMAENIACIRQRPFLNAAGTEYTINLLVNKENKQKFAKIEETVPAGFTAVDIDNKDGIFTYKNQKAKFLWMNLPSEPYYMVSYKLIPQNDAAPSLPLISGKFSYLVDEKTIVIDVIEKDLDLASITDEQLQNILEEIKTQPPTLLAEAEQKEPEIVTEPEIKEEPVDIKPPVREPEYTEPEVKEPEVKEPIEQVKQKVTKPKSIRTSEYKFKRDLAYVLEPESGVYYRVQLAAGHIPVNIKRYFRKYSLDREVRKEYHEGWLKYSVGSFPVYKEARDYRVNIWNTTDIDDAFVSAYNDGVRITVQEALMIANQKWYK